MLSSSPFTCACARVPDGACYRLDAPWRLFVIDSEARRVIQCSLLVHMPHLRAIALSARACACVRHVIDLLRDDQVPVQVWQVSPVPVQMWQVSPVPVQMWLGPTSSEIFFVCTKFILTAEYSSWSSENSAASCFFS
jgi:hypothetical protein